MNSSSESISSVVSGVGGASSAAAEAAEAAILLLDLIGCLSEESIAPAAFLFLGWEEIVSTVRVLKLNSSGQTRSWHVIRLRGVTFQLTQSLMTAECKQEEPRKGVSNAEEGGGKQQMLCRGIV
jgi:hypothetical protein